MKDVFYQTEDGHLFDYENFICWLTFKIRELKKEGKSDEYILKYFFIDDFDENVQYIEKLKWIILKHISI